MKADFKETIEIPEGVEVSIEDSLLTFKGSKGEIKRKLLNPHIKIFKKDNVIILEVKKGTKREKVMINTFKAHINNMIKGVTEGFVYKMKICSSHFPMTVNVQGNGIIIKNFF